MIYDLIIGYAGVMHQNVIAWVHEFKWFFLKTFYDVFVVVHFCLTLSIQLKKKTIFNSIEFIILLKSAYCPETQAIMNHFNISRVFGCVCVSREKRKQTQIHEFHSTKFYSKP